VQHIVKVFCNLIFAFASRTKRMKCKPLLTLNTKALSIALQCD
jgi:hypothetical protein